MGEPPRPSSLARVWAVLTALLLGLTAAILYVAFLPADAPPPPQRTAPPAPEPRPPVPRPRVTPDGPRAALLIDDMGYSQTQLQRLLAMEHAIAFAVLPEAPQAEPTARAVSAAGRDLLAHLPCEPLDRKLMTGMRFLTVDLGAAETARLVEAMLDAVPGARGANNHMGSRFTRQAPAVRGMLSVVRRRGLFFVDSVTAAGSVAHRVARDLGIPSARRDVFLVDDHSLEAVARQLKVLEEVARRQGTALAIGHPREDTMQALEAWLDSGAGGINLVTVSDLLSPALAARRGAP